MQVVADGFVAPSKWFFFSFSFFPFLLNFFQMGRFSSFETVMMKKLLNIIQSIPFPSNPIPQHSPQSINPYTSHIQHNIHILTPPTLFTDGIELSPDYKHIYVTDTGVHTFAGKDNATDPANIYKFDITPDGKRLENRQVFAYSERGFPDGIHTDTEGNVYSAMSDGVHV